MVLYGQWALRLCTGLPELVLQQCLFHLGRFQPLLWKMQNATSLVVAHDVWVDDCLVGGRISPGYHCAGENPLPPKTYSASGADVPRSRQFASIVAGDSCKRKFGIFSSPHWYKLDVDSGWTTTLLLVHKVFIKSRHGMLPPAPSHGFQGVCLQISRICTNAFSD